MNTKKIAVIGQGYVGLPLAIEFGKKYNNVRYIAGAHHEYIDGTGYPNKMENKELSIFNLIL